MSLHLFVSSDVRKVLEDLDRVDRRARQMASRPIRIRIEAQGLSDIIRDLSRLTPNLRDFTREVDRLNRELRSLPAGALNGLNNAARQTPGFFRQAAASAAGFISATLGINLITSAFNGLKDATIGFSALQQNTLIGFETNLRVPALCAWRAILR